MGLFGSRYLKKNFPQTLKVVETKLLRVLIYGYFHKSYLLIWNLTCTKVTKTFIFLTWTIWDNFQNATPSTVMFLLFFDKKNTWSTWQSTKKNLGILNFKYNCKTDWSLSWLWPLKKWKITNILQVANCRAKRSEIWDSGVLTEFLIS